MQTFISDTTSIAAVAQTIIALVVIGIFVMTIFSFLMTIRDFITSKGEEEKKNRGRDRIKFMLIGIVLVIVFLLLLPLSLRWIGVLDYQAFSAPAIFGRAGEILNFLFSLGGVIQDYATTQGGFNLSPTPLPSSNLSSPHYQL